MVRLGRRKKNLLIRTVRVPCVYLRQKKAPQGSVPQPVKTKKKTVGRQMQVSG